MNAYNEILISTYYITCNCINKRVQHSIREVMETWSSINIHNVIWHTVEINSAEYISFNQVPKCLILMNTSGIHSKTESNSRLMNMMWHGMAWHLWQWNLIFQCNAINKTINLFSEYLLNSQRISHSIVYSKKRDIWTICLKKT